MFEFIPITAKDKSRTHQFGKKALSGACADALYGPRGYENVTLRMESQALSTRNRISEDLARSELESVERDARCALLHEDQQFQNRSPRTSKTGKGSRLRDNLQKITKLC